MTRQSGETGPKEAAATDTAPLVGVRVLDGHSLYVEVENGGRGATEPMAKG